MAASASYLVPFCGNLEIFVKSKLKARNQELEARSSKLEARNLTRINNLHSHCQFPLFGVQRDAVFNTQLQVCPHFWRAATREIIPESSEMRVLRNVMHTGPRSRNISSTRCQGSIPENQVRFTRQQEPVLDSRPPRPCPAGAEAYSFCRIHSLKDQNQADTSSLEGPRSHPWSRRTSLPILGAVVALGMSSLGESHVAARAETSSSSPPLPGGENKVVRGQFVQLGRGLQALDIRQGTGPTPQPGDKVAVHYYARLAAKQGWRFDSTYDHKDKDGVPEPFEFFIGGGQVIEGLDMAVRDMHVGGTRRVIIPPSLGYQAMADEPIPPNFFDRQRLYTTIFNPTRIQNGEGSTLGTLIFDIQLLGIRQGAR